MSRYRHAVLLGGRGAMGALFARQLRDHCDRLVTVDRIPPQPGSEAGADAGAEAGAEAGGDLLLADVTRPDRRLVAAIRRADLVVVTLPEDLGLRIVEPLGRWIDPDALVVDTFPVKSALADAVGRSVQEGEWLSISPMFAPSLGFTDQAVIAVPLRSGPSAKRFSLLLDGWGARVTDCDVTEHDELCAALQVVPHVAVLSFAATLATLDLDTSRLCAVATPPFRALLGLAARMVAAPPHVYGDIQHGNPHAPAARAALVDALGCVVRAAAEAPPATFEQLFEQLRTMLGSDLEELSRRCARMLAAT